MGRHAITIELSEQEADEIRRRLGSGQTPQGEALRLRIVELSSQGLRNQEIARRLDIALITVGKWRKRFASNRLAGLRDNPRSGKPARYDKVQLRVRILSTLEEPAPAGQAAWDGPSLAAHLGVSDDMVWRVLRKEGICVARRRTWCISTDPEFAPKAADIVGLYLHPPVNALVISVDEKPSIQALSRRTGYVQTSNGKIVRGLQSTYKRNGTLTLFAALRVATGTVVARTSETKKRPDFLAFMDSVIAELPTGQEIHVILDNLSTHKKNDAWLAQHNGRVHFHFTPTSASWLNLVEVWFGLLTRKTLRGASFHSKEHLRTAIEAYITSTNAKPKPFIWRKREVNGAQLRNTIVNLRK